MITYRAAYKYCDDGVHAEVLDFPGAISCGQSIEQARENLAGALVDMAETQLQCGAALPVPDTSATDTESDVEEPIHLLLTASSRVNIVPEPVGP